MREYILNFVALMGLLGIPTIFSMTVYCIKKCKEFTTRLEILANATQASMRSKLLEQYHMHEARGWISEEDLEDWQNQYNSYHALGANGVLDARKDKLIHMPNSPQAAAVTINNGVQI